MPSKMKNPWKLSDIEIAKNLIKKNKQIAEIADFFGRSYESTKGFLKRHKIQIKSNIKD